MTSEAFTAWMPARAAPRAPGLHVVDATRPASASASARPAHGVPLFVGFGRARHAVRRSGPPVLEPTSRERFLEAIEPMPGGFLAAAVAGFFANGGRLCAVLSVDPGAGPAGLVRAFASGGPLEDVAGIDLVCVPDAVAPADGPDAAANATATAATRAIQAAAVAHCEAMGDRFAILDAVPGPADAATQQSHGFKTRFAALYFPWLRVDDGAGTARSVPPCGHVAGVYARTDARVGVHKAPANERLYGATALEREVDGAGHGALNEAGVNCIRSAAGSGIRIWGARTLSGQADWRHVPVSRLFVALAAWLRHHLDDLVFEPHTPELQSRLQRRIAGRCFELMDAGALAATDARHAFFVKCDSENNPPGSLESGRLVADVGLAPSVPAEFVVVRITHGAGGIAMAGL